MADRTGESSLVTCDDCFIWLLERLDEPPQVKPRLRALFLEQHGPR